MKDRSMDFAVLKKNLKPDTTGFVKIKIAVLCDFASQFLVQALKGYGIGECAEYDVFEADFDQIERQIADPSSELYEYKPQFVIILRSSENLRKVFYKTELSERNAFAQMQADKTKQYYETILSRMDCSIIMNTYPEINDNVFGNYATKVSSSFIYQIRTLNLALMDLSGSHKRLFLADFNSTISRNGMLKSFDPRLYVNSDMVYSLDILPGLVKNVHDIMFAILGKIRKCLILDLDNTLWGGIVGDDGIEGILLGNLGIGKAFIDFQLWIKEMKNRGIIIAVCSKNDMETAKQPFESHPDMVLKLSDIAVFVANWENKVDNIRHIQKVVNISFDSMVFLDDNRFEREMVKQSIPEIIVPSLPDDPSEFVIFLEELNLFETASFTREDEERTVQYQAEAKRVLYQNTYHNEQEYLESLQMFSEARPFETFTIPRVAQLTQRSNQFNLRTVRYTEEEIRKFVLDDNYFTISFTLQDNFGESGLISTIILKKQGDELFIDTWIMSCRVLKRSMENFVLNTLVAIARENGFKKLIGEYIPTAKNGMVKNHYSDMGFLKRDNLYVLSVANYTERPTFIKNKQTK